MQTFRNFTLDSFWIITTPYFHIALKIKKNDRKILKKTLRVFTSILNMIILSSVYRALVKTGDRILSNRVKSLIKWDHPAGPKTIFFWSPLGMSMILINRWTEFDANNLGQNLIWDLTGFWRDTEMRNDRDYSLSHWEHFEISVVSSFHDFLTNC